jgi:hypothetical protein
MPCFTKQGCDGCHGSHDHVIAAAEKVAQLLPIMGVQGTQKVTGVFSSFCFDFERVFFLCSDGSIDHGMVRGGFQR